MEKKKNMKDMYDHSGIKESTVHGMMVRKATREALIIVICLIKSNLVRYFFSFFLKIDAGSTGTRLHLYEWNPRILHSEKEVEDAVSGGKLSYPGTDSRWTDRIRPGIATFAELPDDQLLTKIADAHFWLGEALYSQGNFNEAAKTFLNAHQSYNTSPKAPEMLLKLGMSLAALDNTETACATLREVSKRYPKASRAVVSKVASEQKRLGC